MGLNDVGQVCGYYTDCDIGPDRAFASFDGVTFTTLAMPPGTSQSRAIQIGPHGQIIGNYVNDATTMQERGFLLDNDVFTDLGVPPSGNRSVAEGINAQGTIVGAWGNVTLYFPRPYLWQDGVMTDLTADFPLPDAYPKDINNRGEITGYTGNPVYPPDYRPFIWRDGKVTLLPLDGLDGAFAAEGTAINDAGQVCGIWWKEHDTYPFWARRAFFWDGQQMHDLGLIEEPGFYQALALDLNDVGDVVGYVSPQGTNYRGFVWRDGRITVLSASVNVPNLYISRPFSLNAAGEIAAEAIFLGVGRVFSIVLTPQYPTIGDANCDQAVNIDDLLAVVGTWFAFGGPTDLNNDNLVDLSDLLIVVDHWSR